MKVLKFGGTSLGSPERFLSVAKLVSAKKEEKIVVLSAVSGTTNQLVEIDKLPDMLMVPYVRLAINNMLNENLKYLTTSDVI